MKKLESKALVNKKVEQTGLLFKVNETDFILGASPLITPEIMPTGDWSPYVPGGETQARMFTFDTLSCATFSALNIVETWVNYFIANNKLTVGQLETLNQLGFFKDGKFNAADRFTAIMSGTTQQGNYLQNVWDSIRKDGLLPEQDLPFDPNFKSWGEYHNPNAITQVMKDKAKKILDIFEFSYEWVVIGKDISGLIPQALKTAPLHVGIPYPAYHAVEQISVKEYFDSYDPYIKKANDIHFALKPFVRIKMPQINEVWVKIKREVGNSKETLGTLIARNGQATFTCKTLELPWLNNQRNISCIPKGTYQVKQEWWWSKAKSTYLLQNVTGRGGIRIHSGNYFSDIQGCILLGNSFVDINKDGILDVVNSRVTIQAFEQFMGKKPFTLIVE